MQPSNDHQNLSLVPKIDPRSECPCDSCERWRKGEAVTAAPLVVTDAVLERIKHIIATKPVRAAGYRLKVLLIESDKGLSAGEAEIAPTLAKLGMVTKSDNQKSREDRGSDTALIVDVGPAAWCRKDFYGPEPWAKVGMVVKMIRYTGHAYEEPPGSGKRYALVNDEDIMGYYSESVTDHE